MLSLTVYCTRCGREVDRDGAVTNQDFDYYYCLSCEEEHQKEFAMMYPFGQCDICGAEGHEYKRPDGTVEIRFYHDECICPRFIDWADMSADDEAKEAAERDAAYDLWIHGGPGSSEAQARYGFFDPDQGTCYRCGSLRGEVRMGTGTCEQCVEVQGIWARRQKAEDEFYDRQYREAMDLKARYEREERLSLEVRLTNSPVAARLLRELRAKRNAPVQANAPITQAELDDLPF